MCPRSVSGLGAGLEPWLRSVAETRRLSVIAVRLLWSLLLGGAFALVPYTVNALQMSLCGHNKPNRYVDFCLGGPRCSQDNKTHSLPWSLLPVGIALETSRSLAGGAAAPLWAPPERPCMGPSPVRGAVRVFPSFEPQLDQITEPPCGFYHDSF